MNLETKGELYSITCSLCDAAWAWTDYLDSKVCCSEMYSITCSLFDAAWTYTNKLDTKVQFCEMYRSACSLLMQIVYS